MWSAPPIREANLTPSREPHLSTMASSAAASGSSAGAKAPPPEFINPITQDVMTDPVVTADGHTYDRPSITQLEVVPSLPQRAHARPLARPQPQPHAQISIRGVTREHMPAVERMGSLRRCLPAIVASLHRCAVARMVVPNRAGRVRAREQRVQVQAEVFFLATIVRWQCAGKVQGEVAAVFFKPSAAVRRPLARDLALHDLTPMQTQQPCPWTVTLELHQFWGGTSWYSRGRSIRGRWATIQFAPRHKHWCVRGARPQQMRCSPSPPSQCCARVPRCDLSCVRCDE